jgi:hypothetical protein
MTVVRKQNDERRTVVVLFLLGVTCTVASQCPAGQYLTTETGSATVTCSGDCLCQPSTGTSNGTISDGRSTYKPNAACNWLISSSGLISLSFSCFDTESSDYVTINRCTSSTNCAELNSPNIAYSRAIARLSRSKIPTDLPIYTSGTGYMHVGFKGYNGNSAAGFDASWNVQSTSTCVCEVGTYSTAVGSSTCINCPSNSISPAGSAALTNCICNAGSSGPNGGICTVCVEGKYKSSAGSVPCTNCGTGKYSTAVGASLCTSCGGGTYSAATGASVSSTCIACNAGDSVCACDAGLHWKGSICQTCLAGKFKTSIGSDACTDCGTGTYFTSTGATVCTSCGAGTYSAAVGASACSDCPSNSNSPAGSVSLTSCTCNIGSSGHAGDTCTVCVAGKVSLMDQWLLYNGTWYRTLDDTSYQTTAQPDTKVNVCNSGRSCFKIKS